MNKKRYLLGSILIFITMCILPACQAGSPSPQPGEVERMTNYLTLQDGRLIEYELLIPRIWIDEEMFIYRKDGNVNYFDYNSGQKQSLFKITAFTEAEWQQAQQEAGQGEKIVTQDGITLVYNVALDNPYDGLQAENFQKMVGEVNNIVDTLTMTVISSPAEMELARGTLLNFFQQLATGNYTGAVELFGGPYENLIDMNPNTDSKDHAALMEQACTINGFSCLRVKEVVRAEQTWPDLFTFTVEFSNPDGSLFERSACCGADETQDPTVSQFQMRVSKTPGGNFKVLDMPVYVP